MGMKIANQKLVSAFHKCKPKEPFGRVWVCASRLNAPWAGPNDVMATLLLALDIFLLLWRLFHFQHQSERLFLGQKTVPQPLEII